MIALPATKLLRKAFSVTHSNLSNAFNFLKSLKFSLKALRKNENFQMIVTIKVLLEVQLLEISKSLLFDQLFRIENKSVCSPLRVFYLKFKFYLLIFFAAAPVSTLRQISSMFCQSSDLICRVNQKIDF